MKFYDSGKDAGEIAHNMLHKIMVLVLAICAPIASILASANVLFRIPDFYRYEFDRLDVSRAMDLGVGTSELGSFFSNYMTHGVDTFAMTGEYQGLEQEYFTAVEDNLMSNFRLILDVSLVVAVVALVLTVICVIFLHMEMLPKSMRVAVNLGSLIYLCLMGGLAFYFNFAGGAGILRDGLLGGKLGGDALLPQMFDARFVTESTVAIVVVSLVLMLILRYIVWKMTAKKGIFSESLKGIGK